MSVTAPITPPQEQIKQLSNAYVELYPIDLRDPEVQIALAALSHNMMFQKIAAFAERAALTMALGSVESKIERGF